MDTISLLQIKNLLEEGLEKGFEKQAIVINTAFQEISYSWNLS
jgi:hypothetical protein